MWSVKISNGLIMLALVKRTEMLLNTYLGQKKKLLMATSAEPQYFQQTPTAAHSASIFIHSAQSWKLCHYGHKEQRKKPRFIFSHFLGQLESPACPQSLDDMLIPDHKAIREKQCDCCHGNKAWFMKKISQIINLQGFILRGKSPRSSPYSTSCFFHPEI